MKLKQVCEDKKTNLKRKEKILCILFDNSKTYFRHDSKNPFFKKGINETGGTYDNLYNEYYALMSKIGKKNLIKVILADYYSYSNFKVNNFWCFENKWVEKKEIITPDFFYDKFPYNEYGIKIKKELTKKKLIFNSFKLEDFCKDKFKQSKIFNELSPKTFLVKNNIELIKKSKLIKSNKLILKPRYGLGGNGIIIFEKTFIPKIDFDTDYVLQEFIDTSKGISKTKINNVHDIRLIIINGKLAYCYARVQKHGDLSNVTQGAETIKLRPPAGVNRVIKTIDSFMEKFGVRLYSIDLFYSNKKYYLVELNSKPALDLAGKKISVEEINFFKSFFKKIFVKKIGV